MKNLLVITLLLLNSCTSFQNREHNSELPLIITGSDIGKYQIRSMEDYHKYYIDTVQVEAGDDKDHVIRIALEDGYLNNPEGSDVYVHTKIRLIAYEENVDKRIELREVFLNDKQFSKEATERLKPLEQVESLKSRYTTFVRLNALIQAS